MDYRSTDIYAPLSELTVCNDDTHYANARDAFRANTDRFDVAMQWWKTSMPDIIAKTSSTEPFRVLAVGTGDGKPYDEELLNMLCTSQKHVVYMSIL